MSAVRRALGGVSRHLQRAGSGEIFVLLMVALIAVTVATCLAITYA